MSEVSERSRLSNSWWKEFLGIGQRECMFCLVERMEANMARGQGRRTVIIDEERKVTGKQIMKDFIDHFKE
jgi:hypothetical protein